MIRRPPRSTLFPTRRSSDLIGAEQVRRRWRAQRGGEIAAGRIAWRQPRRSERGTPEQRHRSEEHTSELQSRLHLVCRLLLEKKKKKQQSCACGQTDS